MLLSRRRALQAHCRRDAGIRGARVGQQRAPRLGQKTNRRAYEEALAKGPGGRGKTSALAAARQGCRPSRTRPPAARSGLPPCRAQLVRHGSSPVHHPALVDAKLHLAEAAKVSALEDLLEPLMEGGPQSSGVFAVRHHARFAARGRQQTRVAAFLSGGRDGQSRQTRGNVPVGGGPGVESNVTEGVANGDEYIFITPYERQKHIRIRNVRLGLNPIELLPEKTDEARHFGVMQSKTRTKVHDVQTCPGVIGASNTLPCQSSPRSKGELKT